MRSEPHSFQVSTDNLWAKNKPLKYFHSVFSPLPSAIDLGCSNNFKRKKQFLGLTTVCTHTHMHSVNTIIAPPWLFLHLSLVTSLLCLSATSPLLCLRIPGVDPGGEGHWLPEFPEGEREDPGGSVGTGALTLSCPRPCPVCVASFLETLLPESWWLAPKSP